MILSITTKKKMFSKQVPVNIFVHQNPIQNIENIFSVGKRVFPAIIEISNIYTSQRFWVQHPV